MLWSSPKCAACSSASTRFELARSHGVPGRFHVAWMCDRCRARMVDGYPAGVGNPRPDGCLNCDGSVDASGVCETCGIDRAALVERVRAQFGVPPRLEAIREFMERGPYRIALNALDLRLAGEPRDLATLLAKADLLLGVRCPSEALVLLRRAIEYGANDEHTAVSLGMALTESGQPEQALRVYADVLARVHDASHRGLVLNNIGASLIALQQVEQALDYFRAAIECVPEHIGPRWSLYACLVELRRYGPALEALDAVLELPGLGSNVIADVHACRAGVLVTMRRFAAALAAVDRSLVANRLHAERLEIRAKILVELGRFRAARVCIGTLVRVEPLNEIARELLEQLGRTTAAETN